MQKVKPDINNSADSSEALAKHLEPDNVGGINDSGEVSRRACSSAAMLAVISMGAAGVLLPNQGDEVKASEVNNLNLTSLPTSSEANNTLELAESHSEATELPQQVAALPAPPAIKHKVQQGDTLWELSKNYKVQPEKIAASNELQSESVLSVGQTLDIPSGEQNQPTIQADDSVTSSHGIPSTPEIHSSDPLGQQATVPETDNVDELLRNRQAVALQDLQEQRQRLRSHLEQLQTPTSHQDLDSAIDAEESSVEIQEETSFPSPIESQDPEFSEVQPEGQIETSEVDQSPIPVPVASSTSVEVPVPSSLPVVLPIAPEETPQIPSVESSQETAKLPEDWIDSAQVPSSQVEYPTIPSVEPNQEPENINAQTYQVKPGDTLDEIAKRYGMSRSELAEANGIRNPHFILVNQAIEIPNPTEGETSTLLPGVETIQAGIPAELEEPTPISVTVKESVQETSTFLEIPNPSEQNTEQNTAAFATRNSRQSRDNLNSTQVNPYVEKLRLEIDQMREEMRTRGSDLPEMNQEVLDETSSGYEAQSTPSSVVNPEWQVDQRAIQSTPELESAEDQPLVIEPQENQSESTFSPRFNQQEELVAVAPVPVETYNSELEVPVGQQVAPELPSLSEPDNHLPDAPQPFTGFTWPAKGVLTSGYGWRWGRMHKGIDIAAPIGTPIVAAGAGEVISAGWNSGGYGNLVKLKHPDGSITLYAHNNRILVRPGQYVNQGQQIAEMGSTGYSTGPHLHFEIHPSGQGAVNPVAHLPNR